MTDLGLRSLASNIFGTLGRQVIAGLLQLATVAVIARGCGPEGIGTYNIALLLPTLLVALLNMGIAAANAYYLGVGSVTLVSAWQATLRLWFVIAIVGVAIGTVSIFWFADDWFPGVSLSLLWLALATFPVLLLLNLLSSLFQGMQQFRQFNLIMLLLPSLTLISILVLLLLAVDGVAWLLAAYFFSSLATLLVAIKLLNDLLSGHRNSVSGTYVRTAIKYGYKAHLSNLLTFINYKADMLLVNFFLGPAAAGVYVIAIQLAERLWMLSQSVSTVILPRLSELSNEEDIRRQLTPMISRWVLWFTFSIAVLLAVIAYPLISLLFGAEFISAALPLWLLLPGIVLIAPARVLANDIAARGRPGLNVYASCAALFFNILGNIMLIPTYGLAGAALATSVAYTVIFLMCLWMHHYLTGVSVWKNLLLCRQDVDTLKTYFSRRP